MKRFLLIVFMSITTTMGYAQTNSTKADAAMDAYENLISCITIEFYKAASAIENYDEIKKELINHCKAERDQTHSLLKESGLDTEVLQMRIEDEYQKLEHAHKLFIDTALEQLSYAKIAMEHCDENERDVAIKSRDFIKSILMRGAAALKDEKAYEKALNIFYSTKIQPLFGTLFEKKLSNDERKRVCSQLNEELISFKKDIDDMLKNIEK